MSVPADNRSHSLPPPASHGRPLRLTAPIESLGNAVLQVVTVWRGRIVGYRLLIKRRKVTIGSQRGASFVTPKAEGKRSFALINAGWYLPITDGRRLFVRRGGHWLTLVAAGIDEHGKPEPNMIVVKDPAPYAGSEPADEFVRLEPLEAGYMSEQMTAVPARGYYRMTGGMHVKRDGEIAILDGVIVGEL